MWQEYAIEPAALVRDWPTLQRIADGMGWDTGRLLAIFPRSTYRRSVGEAIPSGMSPIAYSRFEERLRRLLETASVNLHRECKTSENTGWLQLAQSAHAVRPFHAIVALTAHDDPGFAAVDDLDRDIEPWKCEVTSTVTRDPTVLAAHCRILCAETAEISVIDPFYDLTDLRILTALEALVDACPPPPTQTQRFNIHLKATGVALDPAAFEQRCRSRVSAMLRRNQRVHVYLWGNPLRGDRFHDRHVLTEKGGLVCPGGADGGLASETTTLSRHSRDSAAAENAKFDPTNPSFALIRDFEVS